MIKMDDFGCKQELKNVLNQCHFVDIRIRLNGKYYWFEGDYLKEMFKHFEFVREKGEIGCAGLETHEEGYEPN